MAAPQLTPRDIVKEDDPTTWDIAWQKGVTPWDAGAVQPSLRQAVESSGLVFPPEGRAFVPGCGSGYDLTYIAATLGFETVGLEISETAITVANKRIEESGISKASIRKGDFFDDDVLKDEKFDLVYDHTFFCAIPPSKRPQWGQKMAQLIKPGGHLIAICYPQLPYIETGPPYYLRPDHYDAPLGDLFEKVVDNVVPEVSSPSHEGKELIMVWKRK